MDKRESILCDQLVLLEKALWEKEYQSVCNQYRFNPTENTRKESYAENIIEILLFPLQHVLINNISLEQRKALEIPYIKWMSSLYAPREYSANILKTIGKIIRTGQNTEGNDIDVLKKELSRDEHFSQDPYSTRVIKALSNATAFILIALHDPEEEKRIAEEQRKQAEIEKQGYKNCEQFFNDHECCETINLISQNVAKQYEKISNASDLDPDDIDDTLIITLASEYWNKKLRTKLYASQLSSQERDYVTQAVLYSIYITACHIFINSKNGDEQKSLRSACEDKIKKYKEDDQNIFESLFELLFANKLDDKTIQKLWSKALPKGTAFSAPDLGSVIRNSALIRHLLRTTTWILKENQKLQN